MDKRLILDQIPSYFRDQFPEEEFIPGVTHVKIGGRVFDSAEIENLVDAALDFWLTTDSYAEKFSKGLADFLKMRSVLLCNSGSSANLLAISTLTSREVNNTLYPGDEVITVAAGFPTTISGILQNRLVPVFVDIELDTYNVDVRLLERALSNKTRAVMLAHTLGHPFDLGAVSAFCIENNLYLIEDNCDSLGATYEGKLTGTFGDLSTISFFPAHHITTGQGGAVVTNNKQLLNVATSFRDWGRACYCSPGHDDTCGHRYDWQYGSLPRGYDHKYIYTHIGYNLEMTDLQAAIGLAQLDKLPRFIQARKDNWQYLYDGLHNLYKYFALPVRAIDCDPSWFGFALRVREDAPFVRQDIVNYLANKKIDTRLLFAGNLTRQPAFQYSKYRVATPLTNTDIAMNDMFWVGVYPGLSKEALEFVIETMYSFIKDIK